MIQRKDDANKYEINPAAISNLLLDANATKLHRNDLNEEISALKVTKTTFYLIYEKLIQFFFFFV